MDQCTLYLALPPGEDIALLLQEKFSTFKVYQDAEGGSAVLKRKGLIAGRTISLSWRSEEYKAEAFTSSMQAMYRFFAALKTPHEDVREKLLAHLQLITLMAVVTSPKEIVTEDLGILLDIAGQWGGFLMFPPCDLYTSEGELLLNGDGESELESYTVNVPAVFLDQYTQPTESGERRKERTNRLLATKGVLLSEGLPPIVGDENVRLRSREEIAERAVGIVMTAIHAELLRDSNSVAEARDNTLSLLLDYEAADCLSPAERAFIASDEPDDATINCFLWRYECFWVALWVLGYVGELDYPDTICNVSEAVSFLREAGSIAAFTEGAVLRKVEDILDAADFIYRCDWACVDAQIRGKLAPGGLNEGVVVERHRMLNWIIRYLDQEWDDVRTDT